LPLVDRFGRGLAARALLDATLLQALPWLLVPVLTKARAGSARALALLNLILLVLRLGVLVGAARAYPGRPWTYWLSPLADGPALLAIWASLFRRQHRWRGRILVEGAAS
jgi:dolichol-phosphate mannosyltransferase